MVSRYFTIYDLRKGGAEDLGKTRLEVTVEMTKTNHSEYQKIRVLERVKANGKPMEKD